VSLAVMCTQGGEARWDEGGLGRPKQSIRLARVWFQAFGKGDNGAARFDFQHELHGRRGASAQSRQ
jgi:hypothetical protein